MESLKEPLKTTSVEDRELIIGKVKDGTVIDHIIAGNALYMLNALGITGKEKYTISLAMHVKSKKLGTKDLAMLHGRHIDPHEADIISLLAPDATVNDITDGNVRKYKVRPPKVVKGILKCDETCISMNPKEPVKTYFKLVGYAPNPVGGTSTPLYECYYCGRPYRHTMLEDDGISKHSILKL